MQNNYPKLGPIIIGVTDMEKAKHFYTVLFGIVINDEKPNYVSAHMADGTHLELEKEADYRFPDWAAHNVGTFKNSQFEVDDILSFLKKVEQLGGSVISEITEPPWGGYAAEFSDLDGNIFLISQS